ncbi:MAG: 30S ribosomal protein S9 [Elusimicrobia bacterium]|nr:30S ribosomal protein S9 [Elusimicrobiota bacterium]
MEASGPNKTERQDFILTTGKRKTAIARTFLSPQGQGKFVVNGKPMEQYFGNHPWQKAAVLKPLAVSKLVKADVRIEVRGGGVTGQADAIKHGLARAIAQIDGKLKKLMRDQGFLTRDSRIVERKKPGRPKARRRFQFSKR